MTSSDHPRSGDRAEAISLFDPAAQNEPLRAEMREAFERVLAGTEGDEVEVLERGMATAIGCAHAVGVASGSDALLMALMALGVGAGDEVVTSAFADVAAASAITRLGARPVFVDVDAATSLLDLGQVPAAVTERTKVILPSHLYGQPADMAVLRELAGAFSIPVVEDAARAIFAATPQGQAGTLGTIGCFSLSPRASFGALGEAGLLTTDEAELADRLRAIRAHGAGPDQVHAVIGGNFRMDALQAAILRVKLPHAAGWAERRRDHASLYELLLMESGLSPSHVVPLRRIHRGHVYDRYVVRVLARERRDGLRAFLAERGIATEVGPQPLHLQHCFSASGHHHGSLPVAERAASEVLALPVHAGLESDPIERVVDAIAAYFEV